MACSSITRIFKLEMHWIDFCVMRLFLGMMWVSDEKYLQTLEVAGTKASLRVSDFVICNSDDKSEYHIGTSDFDGFLFVQKGETVQGGACNQVC